MPISSGLMLAAGLGQGLSQGVKTYKEFRDANEEKRQKDLQLGLMAAKEGQNYDPSTGLLSLSDVGAAKNQASIAQSGLLAAQSRQGLGDITDQGSNESPLGVASGKAAAAQAADLRSIGHHDLADALEAPNLTPHQRSLIAESPTVKEALTRVEKGEAHKSSERIASTRAAAMGANTGIKTDALTQKLTTAMQKDLEPDAARAGNFGQISNKLIQAQVLKRLATDSEGNILNLPAPQQEEMAMGLARMLSGSNVNADARIKALVPKSVWGDVKKTASWLLNEPEGADQQKFTAYMLTTVDREEKLAGEQMKQIQVRRLGAHGQLKAKSPEAYQSILARYGISPEEAEAGGLMPSQGRGQMRGAVDPNEGKMIEDADGNRQVRKGGKWVPMR